MIDTFASYKFRASCNISSLDLHAAFSPLCGDRREMLDAMSGGGRIGLDGRFMGRGCDMRCKSTPKSKLSKLESPVRYTDLNTFGEPIKP
jgi:hypothetical protein